MLKTTKNTTLTGRSVITDNKGMEQIIVSMSANVTEGSNYPSTNKTVQNAELYLANKAACRADMATFDDMVDAMIVEKEATNEN